MRIAATFATVILLCALIGGCGFWMEGEYLSVTPHDVHAEIADDATIEVRSYAQLCNALGEMVGNCTQSGVILISSFSNATVDYYVNSAIKHVMKNTAVGSYAVTDIGYEIGINRGKSVVAFEIEYAHSRSDILGMQQVRNGDEMAETVYKALKQNDVYLVVHTDNYEALDFVQLVQNYANEHPDLVMELPQVGVFIYPERGSERIVELSFSYMTDVESMHEMRERVADVFSAAKLHIKDTTRVKDMYAELYSFLMDRKEYSLETSITPAYSLLQHGVGDSRAFATVYAAFCRQAKLECKVISGTRNAEPWCWNLVRFRDKYYHVDLLRCKENGEFVMQSSSDMAGYVWDYSAFPAS